MHCNRFIRNAWCRVDVALVSVKIVVSGLVLKKTVVHYCDEVKGGMSVWLYALCKCIVE